jgi:hypothetical protein
MTHNLTYERHHTNSWMWRARCSCGWFLVSEKKEVVSMSKLHRDEIEWEPADPFSNGGKP